MIGYDTIVVGRCFRFAFPYTVRFRHISVRIGSFSKYRESVFVFVFDLFVFDIVFVLKCKSENDKGVIPTDPDRFQP